MLSFLLHPPSTKYYFFWYQVTLLLLYSHIIIDKDVIDNSPLLKQGDSPTVETKYEFVQRVGKYFVILYPLIKKYFPDKFIP